MRNPLIESLLESSVGRHTDQGGSKWLLVKGLPSTPAGSGRTEQEKEERKGRRQRITRNYNIIIDASM